MPSNQPLTGIKPHPIHLTSHQAQQPHWLPPRPTSEPWFKEQYASPYCCWTREPTSIPSGPHLHHLPPQKDTKTLVYKTFLYKLFPTYLCPSLSLLALVSIRDTGIWMPPTPPELKLTFKVDMAQREQRKFHLLLRLIPALRGFWKHTLPRGCGQQRQARVQAGERDGQGLSAP